MLQQYIKAQQEAISLQPAKETLPSQLQNSARKKQMTEAGTSSTENMIEGAGMQIALPREYRMIPRPGQVPKQSIAQQIAEFN